MRFLLGIAIGFGIGIAGAVLLAPPKKDRPHWPSRVLEQAAGAQQNGHSSSLMETVRQRLNEALSEANDARKQAEQEMTERYQRTIGKRK